MAPVLASRALPEAGDAPLDHPHHSRDTDRASGGQC